MRIILFLFLLTSTCLKSISQEPSQIHVTIDKSIYKFEDTIKVQYKGLSVRDQYSGRRDDIVFIEVGTKDAETGTGRTLYVTKPNGEESLVLYKPGTYEARIYIYEKPGVVAARSAPFRIMALEEGDFKLKSDEHLNRIASNHFREDKPMMCRAVKEFLSRKPSKENSYYASMKSYSEFCPVVKLVQPVKLKNAVPVVARYICYRLLTTGPNEVIGDLYILPGNKYKFGAATGAYNYNAQTRQLVFTSGPYRHTENWVGIYSAKGEPTSTGGTMAQNTIEIRKKSDIDAGNMRVIQQCSCTK